MIGRHLGQYQILKELGRGGMAVVYKAFHPALHRHVAIKVLPAYFTHDEEFIRRFKQEARAAASLRHPNIVTVHDVREENGTHYMAMEYLEGKTLKRLIQEEGPLPLERAVRIVQQLASALDYAHGQGFVHRDVKATNIIVGPSDRATLTDFGIVKAAEGTSLTRTGSIFGTPEYMSPEQARGHPVDHRTDIYSLGIVCYEMLVGKVPFEGDTPAVLHAHAYEPLPPLRQYSPRTPSWMEEVVSKCLAKDPAVRYQTAGELGQGLGQGRTTMPATSSEPPTILRPRAAPKKAGRETVPPSITTTVLVPIALVSLGMAFVTGLAGSRIFGSGSVDFLLVAVVLLTLTFAIKLWELYTRGIHFR